MAVKRRFPLVTNQQLNQRLGSVLATSADREQGRKNRKIEDRNSSAEDVAQLHDENAGCRPSVDATASVVANNTESQ